MGSPINTGKNHISLERNKIEESPVAKGIKLSTRERNLSQKIKSKPCHGSLEPVAKKRRTVTVLTPPEKITGNSPGDLRREESGDENFGPGGSRQRVALERNNLLSCRVMNVNRLNR